MILKEILFNLGKNLFFKNENINDRNFLFSLYSDTKEEELSMTSMTYLEKKSFLTQQFELRENDYKVNFQNAEFLIIKRKKQNIGRIIIEEKNTCFHLIDIAIIKKARGKGFGKLILKQLILESKNKNKNFKLSVFVHNFKAIKLYESLDLKIVKTENHYYYMQTLTKEGRDK